MLIFKMIIINKLFYLRIIKKCYNTHNFKEEIFMSKKFFAELNGTFVLVFLGTGAAVLGGGADSVVGYASIALAFGLTIVAFAHSIGTVSGAI